MHFMIHIPVLEMFEPAARFFHVLLTSLGTRCHLALKFYVLLNDLFAEECSFCHDYSNHLKYLNCREPYLIIIIGVCKSG
jgi:hypothetical protein